MSEALKLYKAADEAAAKAASMNTGAEESGYWRRQAAKLRKLAEKAEQEENEKWG